MIIILNFWTKKNYISNYLEVFHILKITTIIKANTMFFF